MRNLLFCFSVFGVFLLKLGFGLLSSKEPYWPFELSRWEAGLLSSRPCPVWAQRPARPVNTAMGLARVGQHFIRGCQAAPQLGAAARVCPCLGRTWCCIGAGGRRGGAALRWAGRRRGETRISITHLKQTGGTVGVCVWALSISIRSLFSP